MLQIPSPDRMHTTIRARPLPAAAASPTLRALGRAPHTMLMPISSLTHTLTHTQARRVMGARNLLVFDPSFQTTSDLRVLRALLTRVFTVP